MSNEELIYVYNYTSPSWYRIFIDESSLDGTKVKSPDVNEDSDIGVITNEDVLSIEVRCKSCEASNLANEFESDESSSRNFGRAIGILDDAQYQFVWDTEGNKLD